MRQRDKQAPQSAEETVRDIRRATRRHFSAEEKVRIVLDGLRGKQSITEFCGREGSDRGLRPTHSHSSEKGRASAQTTPTTPMGATGAF